MTIDKSSSIVLEDLEAKNRTGPIHLRQMGEATVTLPAPGAHALAKRDRRWGIVLAGGDGARLRPLTQFICGDSRPKQFCPLYGGRSLLERTLDRAELSIPDDHLLVSLTRDHRQWYAGEVGVRPSQRIVQPSNRDTAPPILHALWSIVAADPRGLVAILPCDHHYSDEFSFTRSLDFSFEIAARRSDRVVLLGARADYPEVEYGWIETGSALRLSTDLFQVRAFREKPSIDVARKLLEQGALWNTFVMVGQVQAFLDMIRATAPVLMDALYPARLWDGRETNIAESIYNTLPAMSFSRRVLSGSAERLAVLRLNNVGWSDLGDPGRALMAVRESSLEPAWLGQWRTGKRAAAAAAGSAFVA